VPTCICVILSIRYDRLRTEYEQTLADLEWYREEFGTEMDILGYDDDEEYDDEEYDDEEYDESEDEDWDWDADEDNYDIESDQMDEDGVLAENVEGTRYVYLTFDDGPSSSTDEILDILDEYNVKATFFVCGKPDTKYTDVYQRIVDDGHTLGMHSYSHKYNVIYQSVDSFKEDLDKLRVFLYETTGVWPKYYRFPGGSSNSVSQVNMQELADYLESTEVTFFDWNISAGDDRSGANESTIYNNVVNNISRFQHCFILMHDAADKQSTVKALPSIIETIQEMDNTVIVPITEDTLPVQHIKK
jgi:peptidoglycan/xylan/chitin deacetylase (PgdA/CDA1 family)